MGWDQPPPELAGVPTVGVLACIPPRMGPNRCGCCRIIAVVIEQSTQPLSLSLVLLVCGVGPCTRRFHLGTHRTTRTPVSLTHRIGSRASTVPCHGWCYCPEPRTSRSLHLAIRGPRRRRRQLNSLTLSLTLSHLGSPTARCSDSTIASAKMSTEVAMVTQGMSLCTPVPRIPQQKRVAAGCRVFVVG